MRRAGARKRPGPTGKIVAGSCRYGTIHGMARQACRMLRITARASAAILVFPDDSDGQVLPAQQGCKGGGRPVMQEIPACYAGIPGNRSDNGQSADGSPWRMADLRRGDIRLAGIFAPFYPRSAGTKFQSTAP
ncbi:hypothetical protein PDE01_17650 [Paracoccus denitrificans]|nr:hypothetical protein PDE01_17650 [Paracoccus denitrificans]